MPAVTPERHSLRWLWLAAGVIAADQLTKAAVIASLRDGGGWAVTRAGSRWC